MPAISKIRFTNAIYENGGKRYNDEIFVFDGYNGAVLLENGGGKTVFVQIALQAILPHSDLGNRKIRDTLALEGNPCHIAIEWITNEMPRRYALTAITLFLNNGRLDSYKYVYEYGHDDDHSIENLPFVKKTPDGNKRPASKEEMGDYFQYICRENINAKTFPTIKSYHKYIEENFKIISTEWRSIGIINGEEGGVDKFFEGCRTTENLIDKLLIPVVEEAMAGNGTEDFVSTFEKQREHFKQHNHLKESIDESKQIQNKIEDYVDIYDEYYKSIGKYNGEKAYGKALYQYIDNEEKDMEIKLNENKNSQNQCKNEFEEQDRMDGSYNLACLKNRFLSFKSKYEDILKNYEIFKDELDTKDSRIQNLKIAKYKKNIKELEDGIALYKKQLESLEKDEEIYDIEKNLKLNSSNIKGYFEFEFKELNKEVSILENKKTKYENELKEFKSMKASLDKEYDELSENRIRLDQDLNTNKKNMNGIKKEILSNPETEKIEDEYLGWGKRVSDIEKYLVDYKEKLKFYKDEKYNLKLELPKYRKQLGIQSSNRSTLKEKINNIKDREEELLLNIKEYIPNLFHTNSIYTKQEQIIGTLENRCERIRKEKENLIIEERMVHRFIDDYNDNDYFTAEPLLDQWLQDWKDQFSFLESGAQYIERAARNMDSNEKEYYKSYPYWAAAVVVADNEENKLKAKLENHIDKITYPIVILTQSSAQEYFKMK